MLTLSLLAFLGLTAWAVATLLASWSDPPCRLCCGDRDCEGPWCSDCMEAVR